MELIVSLTEHMYNNIKAVDSIALGRCNYKGIVMGAIKSIQDGKVAQWIPVEHGLPKDFEQVLCWYEYFRFGNYNKMYRTYGIGFYDSQYDMWGGDVRGMKAKALAWMPLPDPYKVQKI